MKMLALATALLFAVPAAAVDYPDHQGFVNDYAGLLPAETRAALEEKVQAYKAATSIEIAVLIVPTLQGDDPSHYAQEVWAKWHVGKKGEDNGVLLLVVPPPEKKAWIATGYGIQGWLTDLQCKRIIDEVMRPLNLQGRRSEAVVAGVDAVMARLGTTPWAERAKMAPPAPADDGWPLWLIILGIIFLIWLFYMMVRYGGGDSFFFYGGGWGGGGGSDSGGGFGGGDSGGGGGGGDSG